VARGPLALRALPGFQKDIDDLPDLATRKMALDMLVLVRDGKVRGVPLDSRVVTGDLGDCYKLYFDPDGSDKPRFRLVYRYTPTEVTAVALEAVAVGRRANLDAYRRAQANLGRTTPPTAQPGTGKS
jgi:mRNA interferase RelE/StbE